MPVQDLTPQLRTRLSRIERVVGVFVSVATLLLLLGFTYYLYHTGIRKGWWIPEYRYFTFVDSGAGLHPGDFVKLLGFDVGEVTQIEAQPFNESSYGAVFVSFKVRDPYQGYIGSDSKVKVNAADFLGKRNLEITVSSSTNANPTYEVVKGKRRKKTKIWLDKEGIYTNYTADSKGYWLPALESPALTERLEQIVNQAQGALPGILDLTNKLSLVLSNVANMTAQADRLLASTRPMLSNITVITENLKEPKGSLGDWVLPTNLNSQLVLTLLSANGTLTNATRMIASTDANVTGLATNLDATLINLGNITSNLNQQVQSNTNLVKELSDIIIHADEMIQGLKHHWLLRSAFKEKPAPAEKPKPKPVKARK